MPLAAASAPSRIVVTGYGTVEGAVHAMRAGALHYLQKPVDGAILRETVRSAADRIRLEQQNREFKTTIDKSYAFQGILGESHAMHRVFDVMNQIMDTDATVLIRGESGTGKSSRRHSTRPRRDRPFIPLHRARRGRPRERVLRSREALRRRRLARRKGRFEGRRGRRAVPGRDGDMPLATQAHLLRALESGEVAGSARTTRSTWTCASSPPRTATSMVAEGSFP